DRGGGGVLGPRGGDSQARVRPGCATGTDGRGPGGGGAGRAVRGAGLGKARAASASSREPPAPGRVRFLSGGGERLLLPRHLPRAGWSGPVVAVHRPRHAPGGGIPPRKPSARPVVM